MYDKYFTPQEAEQLVPSLEEILEKIRSIQLQLEACDGDFRALAERINASGGLRVDMELWSSRRVQREALATQIAQEIATLKGTGVVLKDVGVGLVDFPARLENEEVYLCWKSGEKQVRYWHRTNEGYTNRKLLTADVWSSSLKDRTPVQ
jgi:hypothetical protein